MRELTLTELSHISGAAPIAQGDFEFLDLLLCNVLDGMATGMSIGGKWGGAGGFFFGALSQLVGLIIPTIMGGALGFVANIVIGPQATFALMADYRSQFSSGNLA